MYVIAEIIYGINFTEWDAQSNKLPQAIKDLGAAVLGELAEETNFIDSAYSGNGEPPQWFGVQMNSFDQCDSLTGSKLSTMLVPTDDHRAKYAELLERLRADPDVSEETMKAFDATEPQVWILWSTS